MLASCRRTISPSPRPFLSPFDWDNGLTRDSNRGCAWTGPSRPGKCTGSPGVMSLNEINDKIKELGIAKPKLNADAYMKELTFDDQWIGYDDEVYILHIEGTPCT